MARTDAVTSEDGGITEFASPVYDYLFSAPIIAAVVLAVAALVRLMRTQHDALTTVLALVLIVFVPLLGPAVYLYLTRRHDRSTAHVPA